MGSKAHRAKPLALAVALVATGCAGGSAWTGEGTQPRETTLVVTNQHWLDMAVYAVRGGTRIRLGTVESNRARIFLLPRSVVGGGEVRLVGDPIGSRETVESFGVLAEPGQQVEWRIGNRAMLSSVVVF